MKKIVTRSFFFIEDVRKDFLFYCVYRENIAFNFKRQGFLIEFDAMNLMPRQILLDQMDS